ncbi:TonB-dependent receptor [Sphingomonas sp. AP4-R1]|uniref:TonB-dependent receptor n=1 Tax=Sphingomonas sp. AP4-R1 TaxID=2735134 RepID=UPI001493785C|nr:TonB-dependent receptor [Sphingomonas sp. AP4-R1]QJU57914.1 TonB-dependent receptor [Sphingomonas sp. AP4-R1]
MGRYSFFLAPFALLSSTSVIAQAAIQSAPAPSPSAKTDGADEKGADEKEVVVTGIRQSLAGALTAKRNAPQVIDAISAEDTGKFPDKNIAEALQRVTGVQLTRAGGEGSSITIRGADASLNRVEINGQTALSTSIAAAAGNGSNRQVDFRDLPTEFLSRVEVVKSATADMTEGGLGGTVRVITRRPFDTKDGYLAGSAQGIYNQLAKTADPRLALIGSKLFAHDTLGVLLSGTYEKRTIRYDQARTTGWRQVETVQPATPAAQNCLSGRNQARCVDVDKSGFGDFYPDIPRYIQSNEPTKRYALNGIVEWRPEPNFKAYVEGTFTRSDTRSDDQYLQIGTTQAVANGGIDTGSVAIADETARTVTFVNGLNAPSGLAVNYRSVIGSLNRRTFNGIAGSEWTLGRLTLSARGTYAKSRVFNNEVDLTATVSGRDALPWIKIDYSNPQQGPNIILPIDPTSTAGVNTLSAEARPRINRQREVGGKFDAEFKPESASIFQSFKAGVEARNLTSSSTFFNSVYTLNGVTGQTTRTQSGVTGTQILSTTTPAAMLGQIQSLLGAHATVGDGSFFRTGDLGFSGIDRWLNLGQPLADAIGVPDPYGSASPLDTYRVKEENIAGYLQTAVKADVGIDLSGVFGVRLAHTRTISYGSQSANNVITPVRYSGSYTVALPSANLRAEIIPNKLVLRATATDVLARPAPSQQAPNVRLDPVALTGSRGNPGLKPYRAWQYDLGAEYYMSRTDYVSLTGFRKDITSFIDTRIQEETINGQTYAISLPVNGTQHVTIQGFEAGAQVTFGFLPGLLHNLGTVLNYTYMHDSGYEGRDYFTRDKLPFPGVSHNSYNASLFYDDGHVAIRGSYNWRSRFLINAQDRGNNPSFGEAFGQFDASLSYVVNKHFSVFLEGVNLTDATRIEDANSIYRRNVIETYGRRVYFGIRGKL